MKTSTKVSVITPVQTKDVSFNEKVEAVDSALKSRAAAQREIKLKWAAIVQILNKYEAAPPSRRVDAGQAATLVQSLTVYVPKPEVAEDLKKIVQTGSYHLNNVAERPDLVRLLEAKFPGFRNFLDEVSDAKNILSQPS